MKPSSVSKAVIAGVFIATACLLLFNFNDSSEVTSYISKQYSETYKLQRNISMAATVNQLSNNKQQNNQNGSAGSWDDLRPLAKELSSYVTEHGHGYTSIDRFGHFNAHPGCTGYDCSAVNAITIEFDGTSRTLQNATTVNVGLRSDCSGGVSAMLFFMGIESTDLNAGSTTFKDYGNNLDASTFSDLEVGDLLIQKKTGGGGHVAMVAYKDNDKVYTFDWGSTNGINNCKDKGWHQEFGLNQQVKDWRPRNTAALYFRRPIKSN